MPFHRDAQRKWCSQRARRHGARGRLGRVAPRSGVVRRSEPERSQVGQCHVVRFALWVRYSAAPSLASTVGGTSHPTAGSTKQSPLNDSGVPSCVVRRASRKRARKKREINIQGRLSRPAGPLSGGRHAVAVRTSAEQASQKLQGAVHDHVERLRHQLGAVAGPGLIAAAFQRPRCGDVADEAM